MYCHRFASIALSAACTATLSAQTEDFKYVASDAGPLDGFGHAADVDGNFVVIGARDALIGGVDRIGAAYVFDRTTGAELYKIVPVDGADYDKFGYSIAVQNGIALIGSPHHDVATPNDQAGAVYIYDLNTGLEIGRLLPPTMDFNGHFGIGVDIDGNLAAVGGFTRKPLGVDKTGEAFVFDWSTGVQLHSLVATDATKGDRMGWTVAIDGGFVLVGAHFDDDAGKDAGSAYIFDATTGAQVHKLLPLSLGNNDSFGWKLDMENGIAVVGAHMQNGMGKANEGAIYVFDVASGNELARHIPPDGVAEDKFGYSIDLDGSRLAVSSVGSDSAGSNAGAVYVLDVITGAVEFKLTASDAETGDQFGAFVRLETNTLVVGALLEDDGGNDAGASYQFDLNSCTTTHYCTVAGGSVNNISNLEASGCDLSSAITLDLSSGPPSQFTYLLIGAGSSVVTNPAGAVGDLCVVGGFLSRYRLDLGAISAAGTFTTDISSSASGGPGFGIPSSGGASIQPGETWNFQYWHRNPSGAPSGFSEAVSVTFK